MAAAVSPSAFFDCGPKPSQAQPLRLSTNPPPRAPRNTTGSMELSMVPVVCITPHTPPPSPIVSLHSSSTENKCTKGTTEDAKIEEEVDNQEEISDEHVCAEVDTPISNDCEGDSIVPATAPPPPPPTHHQNQSSLSVDGGSISCIEPVNEPNTTAQPQTPPSVSRNLSNSISVRSHSWPRGSTAFAEPSIPKPRKSMDKLRTFVPSRPSFSTLPTVNERTRNLFAQSTQRIRGAFNRLASLPALPTLPLVRARSQTHPQARKRFHSTQTAPASVPAPKPVTPKPVLTAPPRPKYRLLPKTGPTTWKVEVVLPNECVSLIVDEETTFGELKEKVDEEQCKDLAAMLAELEGDDGNSLTKQLMWLRLPHLNFNMIVFDGERLADHVDSLLDSHGRLYLCNSPHDVVAFERRLVQMQNGGGQ